MSNLLKNLLIALGLAVLLWVGYTFLLPGADDAAFMVPDASSEEATLQAQEFVARLAELEAMRFDVSVVTDRRFASLVNFRQDIGNEPFGRTNPFAPVE